MNFDLGIKLTTEQVDKVKRKRIHMLQGFRALVKHMLSDKETFNTKDNVFFTKVNGKLCLDDVKVFKKLDPSLGTPTSIGEAVNVLKAYEKARDINYENVVKYLNKPWYVKMLPWVKFPEYPELKVTNWSMTTRNSIYYITNVLLHNQRMLVLPDNNQALNVLHGINGHMRDIRFQLYGKDTSVKVTSIAYTDLMKTAHMEDLLELVLKANSHALRVDSLAGGANRIKQDLYDTTNKLLDEAIAQLY